MKYKILLVLFIIAFIASAIMAFVPNPSCPIGEEGGCSAVQNSEYAKTLGIRNCYIGFIIFLFLTGLTYYHIKFPKKIYRNIIHLGIIIGTIMALWFLYLQEFILNSYCTYCLAVDFAMLAAFIVMFLDWKK